MTNQKLETALELALSVPSSVRAKSPSLETGYSPETQSWELIIRYSGDLVLPEDVTLVSLFGGYGILYLPENRIDEISALPQIEYIEKPKRLSFSLAGAKAAACIPPVTRPPKNLTGENVLIGIIDSGIDIYHPDFRNDDGTTRIVNLWDQTLGQVFSEEEINAALLADDGTFPSRDLSGHGHSRRRHRRRKWTCQWWTLHRCCDKKPADRGKTWKSSSGCLSAYYGTDDRSGLLCQTFSGTSDAARPQSQFWK